MRIKEGVIRKRAYKQLFEWTIKYRELNLRTVSANKTNFPIDRLQNLDTMFEVWILFEFLDFLRNKGAVIDSSSFRKDKGFSIVFDGIEFRLFYEKEGGYLGWASNAFPDFTIEVNGHLKVVMDAKNWLQQKDEAVYKMLGYLDNLDCELGVLFFSNGKKLARSGIIKPTTPLKNHLNQCLINVVTPFSNLPDNIEVKQRSLESLFDQIIEYIK
ncbi:hypothetical protein [Candidatus Nitrososphaera gargensis]|uniref:hypothetical protein n=1 Tax=Candidatus Nitrososphaera gargensis TaxID=497727 RepID=UPI0011E5842E|nr:hypothetical protein [Candidatus Nitrososphaera gargensis]